LINQSEHHDFKFGKVSEFVERSRFLVYTVKHLLLPADLILQPFVTLPYPANGVAVWQSTVTSPARVRLHSGFDRNTGRQITKFYAPGVGVENITVRGEELWVCDDTEQTVYCLTALQEKFNLAF